MAEKEETIVRFEDVSYEHAENMPILDTVNFKVRRGAKLTLMGQNGAGKSTIFQLIAGDISPDSGHVFNASKLSIAFARQVIPREELEFSVRAFFENCFNEKVYDIDPKIDAVLNEVNLQTKKEKLVKNFSGGQQARLLLASALIQNPDVLLLDEPTNNLDKAGILHLQNFLTNYNKTV